MREMINELWFLFMVLLVGLLLVACISISGDQ